MHSSAPRARARSSFSSLEEVTQTRAPQSLPICTAVEETPPPTPRIRRSSPARSRARVTSMRHAVMLTRTNAAASSYDRGGQRDDVPALDRDVLGQPAVGVLAQDAVAYAQAVLAAQAELAGPVVEVRVDRDPVAHRDVADLGSDCCHVTGYIAAGPEWHGQGEAGQAFSDEQVQVIQRGGSDAHQHVAGPDLRVRDVLVAEPVESAVLSERERLHARPRGRVTRPPARSSERSPAPPCCRRGSCCRASAGGTPAARRR